MQKKKSKSLIYTGLIFAEIVLSVFLFAKFYQYGCKISDFIQNSQKILMDPSSLEQINLDVYLSGLYFFLATIVTLSTIVFKLVNHKERRTRAVVKPKKNVKENNFLVKSSDIDQRKKMLQAKSGEKTTDNEIIHQDRENSKNTKNLPQLSDSQIHESDAGKPKSEDAQGQPLIVKEENNMISSSGSQNADDTKVLSDDKGGVGAESLPSNQNASTSDSSNEENLDQTYPQSAEVERFLSSSSSFVFEEFKSEVEFIKDDLLESSPVYGPSDDDGSPYDGDGFHEFYSRISSRKGGNSAAQEDTAQENRLRQVIRDEFYGLVDQTSAKMSENYERLNQIMREIVALRDEIKEIQKSGSKNSRQVEKELNPRLALLKEMEAEGQLVLEEIDEAQKKEAQQKYSKYSLV